MKFGLNLKKSAAIVLLAAMLGGCELREAAVLPETVDMETEAEAKSAEVPESAVETQDETAEIVPEWAEPSETEKTEEKADVLPVTEADAVQENVVVQEPAEDVKEPEPAEVIPETPEDVRERRIAEELARMTVREKLGQMFMVAYGDATAAGLTDYGFGAYILFAGNFESETTSSLSAKMAALQDQSKYGLLTAVDEEGGTVTRISRFTQFRAEKFKSPRTLYSWGGMDLIRSDAAEKAALLTSLGMNLNMAPVADISQNESDFMYWRSVGLDAEGTAEFVRTVIRESRLGGVGSVAKHFPGYGSVADTHTGMAYDDRSLDELRAKDFVPFAAAIEEGVEAVLVSHIITASIDAEKPASVSAKTVALLRDELGYDGIIMTDDLAMSGITDYCTTGNAALEAILAGCDMLCCSNWDTQYPAVWEAVENGVITEERLNESAARILRVKYDMGLWE